MADSKAAPTLTGLPLEIRHAIFEYAAARDVKPKKLLRYWFEKKEVKDATAQLAAADPNGPAPRIIHDNDDHDYDSNVSEGGDDNDEDGEDDESDEEENEEEENDEDVDEDVDEEEEDDEDEADEEEEMEQVEGLDAELDSEAEEEDMEEDQDYGTLTAFQTSHLVPGQFVALPSDLFQALVPQDINLEDDEGATATDASPNGGSNDEADQEVDGDATAQETQHDVGEHADEAMADEAVEEDNDGATTATAPQPPPPAPIVRAHRKWRHIPKFMRVTHCPPPLALLLTSKQLNEEANNWFYDVAVLRIEATGSFAHTSFFEEVFSQITEAAFSPMENIRKVEVTFVWDTTWIRADESGCVDAIFPALLRERSLFVHSILAKAPDLREVVIHWHDSARDNESANLMMDVLELFYTLPAAVKVHEHYIAADEKPHKRSIAGKRRVEFQNILDGGLDRLY
jgi:hypothetical protein